MIVHAFEETLDKGLKRYGEVVVSIAWMAEMSRSKRHRDGLIGWSCSIQPMRELLCRDMKDPM
jgi:hypothetical protein